MHAPDRKNAASRKPQIQWVLIGLLAAAAFLSWSPYRADALGVLPWLLLLACLLMHIFHRRHRHRGRGRRDQAGGPMTGENRER